MRNRPICYGKDSSSIIVDESAAHAILHLPIWRQAANVIGLIVDNMFRFCRM
jgi:hypothetical protein